MIALADAPEAPPATLSESRIIDQLQQTVSASRLNLFLQCRLKFWFRYVAKLQKAKTAALHVGGSVHLVLKAWNMARWKQQILSLKQLYDVYETAWKGEEGDQPVEWRDDDESEQKKTGWRLVETYFRESNIPADQKPDAVEVAVEADLSSHGLPQLIGIIDLVQQGRIIDFKSASQTPNPERVAHTSEVQTSCYSLMYREATGQRENGVEIHTLVKTKNPKLVITAFEPMSGQQEARLFHLMEAYVDGLDRRDFIPSPGLQCAACEFFNECRLWS